MQDIEVLFVEEEDPIVNPLGAKGLGEIGIDSHGYHRTSRATVRDGVWTFSGEHERATFAVTPDGQRFTASWEQRAPGGSE